MTSINNSPAAMVSYYASQANGQAASSKGESKGGEQAASDPLADLRRFAKQMVARTEGGLLRSLNGGSSASTNPLQQLRQAAGIGSGNSAAAIQLPDVASLDRDEAARLIEQVQKLTDAGLDKTLGFSGSNAGKQTDSLETYRQWLQEKGGISVYA